MSTSGVGGDVSTCLLRGYAIPKPSAGCFAVIPYGEVRSYKQIAEAIGSPKAMRAVGNANGNNPLAIFIPCHRVVGSNGALTGFGGGWRPSSICSGLNGLTVDWAECRLFVAQK